MKFSMWMICSVYNSRLLPILVATTYTNNRTA